MSSKISEIHQNLAANPISENRKISEDALSYSEIPGLTDPGLDVLNQLKTNLKMLSDLHQKLQFTVREIKSVIR